MKKFITFLLFFCSGFIFAAGVGSGTARYKRPRSGDGDRVALSKHGRVTERAKRIAMFKSPFYRLSSDFMQTKLHSIFDDCKGNVGFENPEIVEFFRSLEALEESLLNRNFNEPMNRTNLEKMVVSYNNLLGSIDSVIDEGDHEDLHHFACRQTRGMQFMVEKFMGVSVVGGASASAKKVEKYFDGDMLRLQREFFNKCNRAQRDIIMGNATKVVLIARYEDLYATFKSGGLGLTNRGEQFGIKELTGLRVALESMSDAF